MAKITEIQSLSRGRDAEQTVAARLQCVSGAAMENGNVRDRRARPQATTVPMQSHREVSPGGDQRLRESEDLFRLLVESVQEYAIFMLDPDGSIASWNAGARRLKGYEPEEIIGRHFSVFYPEEDVRAGKPERELVLARERGSIEDEGWRVRKDGTKFWADVVMTAVYDAAGNLRGFAKVTRNITDRRKAEQTHRALLIAEDANRAKDEFIAMISHELRTPLTSILGWARMLRIGGLDAKTTEEALDALERSAQAQVHLIEDLLDDARITSGKLRLNERSLEIKPIVESAIADLTPAAEAKRIQIVAGLRCEPCRIIGDPTRLQQVVWNILSNAIKFTPDGGKVFVRINRHASTAEIEVRDTGRGIDAELLPQLFQRFRQGDPASKDRRGGLGLGLSITRHLVELHGGEVEAWSEGSGKGATFTIRLPLAMAAADEFVEREPNRTGELPTLRGVRVLIVEDQADNREVLAAVVDHCGGEAKCSANAEDAMKVLQEWQPDVIVCDIALPDIDGCAFLEQVRLRSETPALALTVLGARDDQARILDSGFQVFRQKPIEPADLAHDIARLARSG
jgi:PAS domain S-box-containing protein